MIIEKEGSVLHSGTSLILLNSVDEWLMFLLLSHLLTLVYRLIIGMEGQQEVNDDLVIRSAISQLVESEQKRKIDTALRAATQGERPSLRDHLQTMLGYTYIPYN